MEWQPIETAPKDVAMLICVAGAPHSVWIARDVGKLKRIWMRQGKRMHMIPTHWMPLPEPPK